MKRPKMKITLGISLLTFLTFLILKLTHVIHWSWWIITIPLWGGFALFITSFILLICAILVLTTIDNSLIEYTYRDKKK